ncbi:peroxiredoxin-like family protein [Amycolatopsis minnesotensis]|uniref:thioredoxin-dependent peroxiredoxin n=1 Tax=Amycolatopsis minnesotensis TaxID=337894 RepID=A0ABN2SSN7_9PSEU
MNELSQGLNGIKEHAREVIPADALATLTAEQRRYADRTDGFVKAGDTVPGFALPDATGAEVTLGELVSGGAAVLVFYRGQWCPFCNLALRAYQEELSPKLAESGARLAAISPQAPDGSLSTKEKNELGFAVLSDPGNEVARSLGITFTPAAGVQDVMAAIGSDLTEHNADGTWELPHPTVLVVDGTRTVRFADVHTDYTERTEPREILAALAAL